MTKTGSIRGSVVLSRLAFVRQAKGEEAVKRVLASLPLEDRKHFAGTVQPNVWYPFEAGEHLDAAIAAGDFALASLLAYRLFWLNAGWQGVIDQREVATWRDALRMVNNEDIRREIRRLLFLVECVRYGRHRPQREEFLEWRARLDSIDTQTVLG